MNKLTETNLKVEKIVAANKAGNVKAVICIDGEMYDYTRAIRSQSPDGVMSIIVSGQRIHFRWVADEYGSTVGEVLEITTEYKVAGKQKFKAGVKKPVGPQAVKPMPELPVESPKLPTAKQTAGEVHHEKYETIKMCLDQNIPVYLAGPAGSGKNHTVEQIAKQNGWAFHFSNSVQQEFKLTGFIDAGGTYHETEFYKACTSEKEAIFFLDEMDASIPEVLVLLNAAIANGYFEFPVGRVELDHVRFVAAGNTVGAGADDMYTGRAVIDQATLDRFAIVEFGYSRNIELSITNQNIELVEFVRSLRDEAEYKGIRAVFSYRALIQVTKLESAGMDLKEIVRIVVVKGLDKDTLKTLTPEGNGKYHRALRSVRLAA